MSDAGQNTPITAVLQAVRGCLQIYRGQVKAGLRTVEGSVIAVQQSNLPLFTLWGAYGIGLAYLSSSDGEGAHAHLAPMVELARTSGITEPSLLRFVPDEIEALVRIGDIDGAEELLVFFEECARPFHRPWTWGAAARAHALLLTARGDVSASSSAIESALGEYRRIAPEPFEEAWTMLVAGEIHRRARAKRKAADAVRRRRDGLRHIGKSVLGRQGARRARSRRSPIRLSYR